MFLSLHLLEKAQDTHTLTHTNCSALLHSPVMKNAAAHFAPPTPEFAEKLIASIYYFYWGNWMHRQTFIHHSWVSLRENLAFGLFHWLLSSFQNSLHTSISCCSSTSRRSVEEAICHGKTKTTECDSYLASEQSQIERTRVLMFASSNVDDFRAARIKPNQPAHKYVKRASVWAF